MSILWFLAALGDCVHLGIDFGSQFVKAAIVETTDHPQVAQNFEGQRLTPHFIGFRASPDFATASPDPLRVEEADQLTPLFGRKAIDLMVHRPWAGTGFLPIFIDQSPEEAQRLARILFVNTSAARIRAADLPTLFVKLFIDSVIQGKDRKSVV
jgi:hypothetical protein